jgi:hypothetical protein
MIKSAEIAAITSIAGALMSAPVACQALLAASYAKGDPAYAFGTTIPISLSALTA